MMLIISITKEVTDVPAAQGFLDRVKTALYGQSGINISARCHTGLDVGGVGESNPGSNPDDNQGDEQ